MKRQYSFPENHWNWPVKLTHKHGVRCGQMIYTGGQVDLDAKGNVRHPGDLIQQCTGALDYLTTVLEDLGADMNDLVKVVVYFVGDLEAEAEILKQIGTRLDSTTRPVVNTLCLPELCYPDMMVEIEAIAMCHENGEPIPRRYFRLDSLSPLPSAFSHAIHCGDMVFTSDLSAISATGQIAAPGDVLAQSVTMMQNMETLLGAVGAQFTDVLKLNVFYLGGGNAKNWEGAAKVRAAYFKDPGPAATGIPVESFPITGQMTKIAVAAMLGSNGESLKKQYAWPDGHWDWTTPLPYKHGNLCQGMIHLGGQVSLDSCANVIDPDDMVAQTKRAMNNIANVLAEFGANLDNVVKVTTFYQGKASAKALHENLLIRSNSYSEPGPATTGIPVRNLVYPSMIIEIEVIAMIEIDVDR